jgi:hypothetical protein
MGISCVYYYIITITIISISITTITITIITIITSCYILYILYYEFIRPSLGYPDRPPHAIYEMRPSFCLFVSFGPFLSSFLFCFSFQVLCLTFPQFILYPPHFT